MSTITLDTQSADLLRTCAQSAVLRDAAGNILGYFEPPVHVYEPGQIPDFDEAELDRREAKHDVLSSAEVRRRLGITR